MPLYLSGGGDQSCFRNLDQFFLSEISDHAAMLVVPLAVDLEDYEDVMDRVGSCFQRKVDRFELAENVDKIDREELFEYDAVFIEGGNTFQLVQAVRQSNFFNYLADYLADGRIIYGDSAGAIILGQHVKTAFLGDEADEDHEKLQDYRGLSLAGDWAIHCHYQSVERDQIQDQIYETGIPILALSESAGIYMTEKSLKVFGEEPLTVFNFSGAVDYPVGSELELESLLS